MGSEEATLAAVADRGGVPVGSAAKPDGSEGTSGTTWTDDGNALVRGAVALTAPTELGADEGAAAFANVRVGVGVAVGLGVGSADVGDAVGATSSTVHSRVRSNVPLTNTSVR